VVIAAGRPLSRPVDLAEMKQDKAFADWEMLRLPRLSVVPVPDAVFRRLMELSGRP
jgi:predicted RNA-binding protein with PUA-like domain